MIAVRIYRPAKSAMQSGRGKTHTWVVEFEPSDRQEPDSLMGWSGSHDTRRQVTMRFESREQAVAFARQRGYSYTVAEESPAPPRRAKNYADNFRFDKVV